MVDANSGLDAKDFGPFVAKIGLCDIIGGTHGIDTPNTHAEGSQAIDFMLATPNIMNMIKRSGMLRFYDGIHSDHRGIYVDLNILHLL